MFLEVGVLGEAQATPATDVRLDTLVEQLVAGEVVFVFKLLMTDLTSGVTNVIFYIFCISISREDYCCFDPFASQRIEIDIWPVHVGHPTSHSCSLLLS